MNNQPTLARISQLETQLRRLRLFSGALAIVVLGLGVAVVEAFREQSDFEQYGLRTTRIVVQTESGAHSALGSHHQQPYFKFVDQNKAFRMFCGLEKGGPVLTFADGAGQPRLRLSADDQGGSIKLLNADGSTHWAAP